MSRDQVHEIAQGRVWTGEKAIGLGLVDQIGGLDEAIATAAVKAGLEDYRLAEYPEIKEPIQQIIEDIMGQDQAQFVLREQLGDLYPYVKYLQEIKQMQGAQARLPFAVEVH